MDLDQRIKRIFSDTVDESCIKKFEVAQNPGDFLRIFTPFSSLSQFVLAFKFWISEANLLRKRDVTLGPWVKVVGEPDEIEMKN